MTKPLISVCCIVYNHKPYIRQALDSVLMQETEYPFEMIVHDDASTDGTTDIIREYAEKYPKIITPIYEEENQWSQGKKVMRECTFPYAKGDYIAVLECDDYWTDPHKLQKQVSYMETHPECSGTFHSANWLNGDGEFLKNDGHSKYEYDATPQQVIVGGGSYCATASLCFRTKYALDNPPFRKFYDLEDYPLQVLLALKGDLHYFPNTMSCYRFGRSGSWTEDQNTLSAVDKKCEHLKTEIKAWKMLDDYTNHMFSTEIYYQIIKDQSDLYAMERIPFSEIRKSFDHMKWGHMKFSRMRRCYDRLLRRYIPGIKQKC